MAELTGKVRILFDGTNFAVLSTLEPDGTPQSTVVCVGKIANLHRDPRASVVIFDPASPYESAQIQGTATIQDDPEGALIDTLSHKYTGGPYPGFAGPNPDWATVRITPQKVTTSWPSA